MVLAVARLTMPDPVPVLALGAVGRLHLIVERRPEALPSAARPLAVLPPSQELDDGEIRP
jgi:hypothetical protein